MNDYRDPRRARRFHWTAAAGLAAIAVWLLLVAIPQTGWLISQQVKALFEPPQALSALLYDIGATTPQASPAPPPVQQRLREIMQKRPNDYAIHLAAALESASSVPVVDQIRALLSRFPSNPALYAHVLRYSTLKEIGFSRPEEEMLTGEAGSRSGQSAAGPAPTPAQLAEFDREAGIGERLDPTNGFFPLVRAVGLFAAHRDSEALLAIQRASTKPRWDDYIADEVHARWHLHELLYGRQSAIQQIVVAAAVLFPHYARIRGVARVAVYKAIEDEQQGRQEEGLVIRRSIMRCGELMRTKSQTLIGSLVGIAITAIATSRPGGSPALKRPQTVSSDQWVAKRLEAYAVYVKRIGHPEDGKYAKAAIDAGRKTKAIAQSGMDLSPAAGKPMFVLFCMWVGGILVASNALWMLLTAGASGLLARLRIGWSGVIMLLACALLILGVVSISLSAWTEALTALLDVVNNLTGEGQSSGIPPLMVKILTVGVAVVVPLLVGVIVLIIAAVRQRPPATVLSRAMAVSALLLVMTYGGLLTVTSRQEESVSAGLERSLHGEGRLLAQLLGKPWPEATVLKE